MANVLPASRNFPSEWAFHDAPQFTFENATPVLTRPPLDKERLAMPSGEMDSCTARCEGGENNNLG